MNEGRLLTRNVRPEQHIIELKLYRAGGLAVAFGQKDESSFNIGGNVGR